MTVLEHSIYNSEGITHELLNDLDVSGKDMVLACERTNDTPDIVDYFNEHYSDQHEPVNSAQDLPEFVFNEWREWVDGHEEQSLHTILEERENEYIFDVDRSVLGSRFYTIMEVHNTESEHDSNTNKAPA